MTRELRLEGGEGKQEGISGRGSSLGKEKRYVQWQGLPENSRHVPTRWNKGGKVGRALQAMTMTYGKVESRVPSAHDGST